MKVSFLFVVVSGNNTEKNMEAIDRLIKDIRWWLGKVWKPDSEDTIRQLALLKTSERVLRHIRKRQNETGTVTYERVCITFAGNVIFTASTALISKATDNVSQGKSDIPRITQPGRKAEEVKGYLQKLKEKMKEIDRVINEIERMVSYLL